MSYTKEEKEQIMNYIKTNLSVHFDDPIWNMSPIDWLAKYFCGVFDLELEKTGETQYHFKFEDENDD